MKSFGKRWRVLENSFFEKDVFFFSSRRAIATFTPCPGLGEAMHVRPDRVMSWSDGSLPIQAGAGSTICTSACKYFHSNFHADRVHRLEHATVITRTVKTIKKADEMLLIVFRFSWLGRTIFFAFLGAPRLVLLQMGKCNFSTLWLSDDRHCAKWAAKPIHFDLTGARPAKRSSSGSGHLHRNLSHTKSMAFSKWMSFAFGNRYFLMWTYFAFDGFCFVLPLSFEKKKKKKELNIGRSGN